MRGKNPSVPVKRYAIADLLVYASEMKDYVFGIAGFRPFDDPRGLQEFA